MNQAACNWIFAFSNLILILSANGQFPLGMSSDDNTPPPNPFGNIDSAPANARPTPPTLSSNPNPNLNPNLNPNPNPVQAANPPPFNPPTPPPLPTPPPIGGGSGKSNAFDTLSSSVGTNDRPVSNAVRSSRNGQKWTVSRSQDDNRLSGAGWPRISRNRRFTLDDLLRLKRQNLEQAAAAAKAARAAGQLAKSAGSIPGAGGSGIPGTGSIPGAESIPGAGSVPKASSIPGGSSVPGLSGAPDVVTGQSPSSDSGGGQPSISTFPDTDGDIVLPQNGTPKPTTPRFLLTRHLDAIKANADALRDLQAWG